VPAILIHMNLIAKLICYIKSGYTVFT